MLNDRVLKKQITINASAGAVWDVLVEPAKIKQYLYGTNTISEWKEGSPIIFTGEWDGKTYTDKGTILKFQKNSIFHYSYYSSFSPLPDLPENYASVKFTLESLQGTIVLHLEQQGFSDDAAFEHSDMNWNSILMQMKAMAEQG